MSDALWLERVAAIGRRAGAFEQLGDEHAAFLSVQGRALLVTFESVAQIRGGDTDHLPLGYQLARARSWSHLCLISMSDTWYRDPEVYGYFDRLIDRDFFDEFDHVIFYGSGICGYAAAAFSVAAPGATVILVAPQATLDPAVAGWDYRFIENRRLDFTSRYGFAPEMLEGAGKGFVLYDPDQTLDAMHAALFARRHVSLIRCRHVGGDTGGELQKMRILPSVLTAAINDTFDTKLFSIFYRSRRNHVPYLRNLLDRLLSDGRIGLAVLLTGNVATRLGLPEFEKKHAELREMIARNVPPGPA